MAVNRWLTIWACMAVRGCGGSGRHRQHRNQSTHLGDALCVSCHSTATLVADPHFQQSHHEANAVGIRVSCSDCYIPAGNWFVETHGPVYQSLKDDVTGFFARFAPYGVPFMTGYLIVPCSANIDLHQAAFSYGSDGKNCNVTEPLTSA